MNVAPTPEEQEERKQALTLDLEIIGAINEQLKRIKGDIPLEKFHGSVTVRIVKGQFAAIECAASYLLPDKKKQARKTA